MSETINPSLCPRPRSHGFTLTEILVTIGIIVILIAIVVPTVSKVQKSARVAGVQAQLNGLQGAITRYQQDHGAFPGPLPNDSLTRTGFAGFANPTTPPDNFEIGVSADDSYYITGTENLVLGLLGGLVLQGAAPGVVAYDPTQVGNGPMNLNSGQLKKFPAYIEATNLSWRTLDNGDKTGDYKDAVADAADTIIPEFVDSFPSPMPILYLRARKGFTSTANTATNNNVITNTPVPTANGTPVGTTGGSVRGHYDLSQIIGYTGPATGGRPDPDGNYIGEGKSVNPADYKPTRPANGGVLPHGLSSVNPGATMLKGGKRGQTSEPGYVYPYDAYPYFKNPSSPDGVSAQPRQKDGYILVSAGVDRVYGTSDDIANFGAVNE